ncbi:unconventional myosin-X-like [Amphiura filiformis]|uniref:unconventional myosin-X-like n=1 Tax=Amphiura filiformis TaxID=82378 RepID=UPI003B2191E4
MADHHSQAVGLEDMAKLTELNDESILKNLKLRYENDQIYTYIGSILAAVNPYKSIPGIYDKAVMERYNKQHIGDLPPHIYAIANDTYYSMWKRNEPQCVLISGESGAGKTESTKFILNYLSEMSQASGQGHHHGEISVEDAILESSPIMEAFGNAKTVYNNNSSRFGKFIQLQFSDAGNITGGLIQDYLLEKNRVVGQNPDERNYHIFYCIMAGMPDESKNSLRLGNPENYRYLNQSGCIWDQTLDDKTSFDHVLNAMQVMKFSTEQIQDVLSLLAAILHIGNVEFITAGGAQVKDMQSLEIAASLLNVDEYQLSDGLTLKTRSLRGEIISTPLDVQQATNARDSLAMNLYGRCFKWIIKRINSRIKLSQDAFSSVGVLDIFGFENFSTNRFEQFNINFANEKLQEYFNKHIFSLEQHEYNSEGLNWVDIDYQDNGECLDLIERKLGILAIIDEESRFPKASDSTLLDKLHSNHGKNVFYSKPRVSNTQFGIQHYAGEVLYDTTGFLEKNRDTFPDDLLHTLKESRSDFIYDLFEMVLSMSKPGEGSKAMRKKPTVSSQFQESLHALMATLNMCNPYFVRCVKPNPLKIPNNFDTQLVLNQLRYSGMLETVKIRRAGFPVRRLFAEFAKRYQALIQGQEHQLSAQDQCSTLLIKYDSSKAQWQMGHSKVFMKEILENALEIERGIQLSVLATKIQAFARGFIARQVYKREIRRVVIVQSLVRSFLCEISYLRMRAAIITFQKFERGRVARRLLAHLKEEKRKEEERLAEEQRRREEEEKRELERLKAEEKIRELAELERKLEEEARQRQAEEDEAKRQQEEQKKADFERALELSQLQKEKEEEARKKAHEEELRLEEERRLLAIEEERLRKEDEERQLMEEIQQREEELDRLQKEALERAEKQILHELDSSLMQAREFEEESIIGEEDDDNISRKSDDAQYFEGFLSMKCGGLGNSWKKRWFVLRDESLMWFRNKQEALKSGWLMKKGGGTSTVGRRNWKKRFFVLKDTTLSYYSSDANDAKLLGKIDIRAAKEISDSSEGHHKLKGVSEGCSLDIRTEDRVFQLVADTDDEISEWYSILTRVKNAQDYELKQMHDEEANPRNAIGSLDVALIDSVIPVKLAAKPNAFDIITAERIINLMGENPESMNEWFHALTHYHKGQHTYKKEDILMSGWLTKETHGGTLARAGANRKKRYFILTSNSLDYYRNVDLQQKLGAIALNSLCSVTVPDEKSMKEEGYWKFTVHGRRCSFNLFTSSHDEAWKWTYAIQDVIDSKPQLETPFQILIKDMREASSNNDIAQVERTYRLNPILRTTPHPLKTPLLPLPYGQIVSSHHEKGYTTLHEEAVKIFNSLQGSEMSPDPMPLIQGILQTCHDLKPLRDEVYCQVVKQSTGVQDPDSLGNLRNWQILACLCCSFLPSRSILRYVRFHIKRQTDLHPNSQIAQYAVFAAECLKRTRMREFGPSRQEIVAILGRREMTAKVYCHGEGSCQISINSATTAGQVVHTLVKGMGLDRCYNRFALYERSGQVEKAIEDRTVIADILSKFERYKARGLSDRGKPWQLFFKLFCFLDTKRVPRESVEYSFLFEQACEDVIMGLYPASPEKLIHLAALRMQFVKGDCGQNDWIRDLSEVYPTGKLKADKPAKKNDTDFGGFPMKQDKENIFTGTLRGIGIGTLRKLHKAASDDNILDSVYADEISATTSSIIDKWRTLKGMSSEHAQEVYMSLIMQWPYYGARLFEVETRDSQYPPELWLAIGSKVVAIHRKGETQPIDEIPYEKILSFGAPIPNEYKIVVEGRRQELTFETTQVFEIAKLMKAYINEIVRKRQSVMSNISNGYS